MTAADVLWSLTLSAAGAQAGRHTRASRKVAQPERQALRPLPRPQAHQERVLLPTPSSEVSCFPAATPRPPGGPPAR